MLEALLAKKGWDKATFKREAKKPLEELNKAEATRWIGRLTVETKGKPAAFKTQPPPPAATRKKKH